MIIWLKRKHYNNFIKHLYSAFQELSKSTACTLIWLKYTKFSWIKKTPCIHSNVGPMHKKVRELASTWLCGSEEPLNLFGQQSEVIGDSNITTQLSSKLHHTFVQTLNAQSSHKAQVTCTYTLLHQIVITAHFRLFDSWKNELLRCPTSAFSEVLHFKQSCPTNYNFSLEKSLEATIR